MTAHRRVEPSELDGAAVFPAADASNIFDGEIYYADGCVLASLLCICFDEPDDASRKVVFWQ